MRVFSKILRKTPPAPQRTPSRGSGERGEGGSGERTPLAGLVSSAADTCTGCVGVETCGKTLS